MVSTGQLLAFALASFILIVIPGPSVLFVVGRALAHGRRTALASVAGNAVGVEVVAICVALGVGTLVQRSALVFTVVKLGGGLYLVWLGVRAVRQRRGLAAAFAGAGGGQRWKGSWWAWPTPRRSSCSPRYCRDSSTATPATCRFR
jgi:threonine/homoserine/homoserine lactone efflux protein